MYIIVKFPLNKHIFKEVNSIPITNVIKSRSVKHTPDVCIRSVHTSTGMSVAK
jgi:hypothetical protein